jgi:peptide-methionine (R)-S-oxide reductase
MNILKALMIMVLLISCESKAQLNRKKQNKMEYKINKTESEWQKELTPAQFYILREKGTERPGTGSYNLHFKEGIYACAACNTPLFESKTKYESHCGWPSFDDAIEGSIKYQKDTSSGMIRTEILCANCGGHLGHIFDDGPQETTGKRYCVNSLSLDFKKNNTDK